mgnify:CR=1 FL=1
MRRRNLAQAVPEDAGGNNAPGLQEASQRDLQREQHRLADVALKNRIVARCKTLREAVTPPGPHQGIEPFDCRADEGHAFEQLAAHARPLPTLSREDEYDIAGVFARVTGDGLAHVRLAGPVREAPCGFVRVVRNDHQTVRMVAAAALHRCGELAETFPASRRNVASRVTASLSASFDRADTVHRYGARSCLPCGVVSIGARTSVPRVRWCRRTRTS